MEADLGAVTSTLRRSDLHALRASLILMPPDPRAPLLNYDRTPLKGVRGSIWTTLGLGGRQAEGVLHVVSDAYDTILGRNSPLRARGRHRLRGAVSQDPGERAQGGLPKAIREDGGGCCRTTSTASSSRTMQCLQYADCGPFPWQEEQEPWRKSKEWTQRASGSRLTDPNEIHGMVTVPKPEGGVHITTDLSPLNTYVVPETHPIPAIKEVFLELYGAKGEQLRLPEAGGADSGGPGWGSFLHRRHLGLWQGPSGA